MQARRYANILPFLVFAAFAGCGPSVPSTKPADAGEGTVDRPESIFPDANVVSIIDGSPGNAYDDADISGGDGGCPSTVCTDPVDDGCVGSDLCGADGSGDGLDNDCDGTVDELCLCTPGDVRPCFRGPPGRRNIGSCEDGTMLCSGSAEFASWGACSGGIFPSADACDTQDNNCNGCADDNPECCEVILACPGPGDLPEASPFTPYTIDGTMFYGGAVSSWTWTVQGGPCDTLLGSPSWELTGANTSMVTFTPTLSGDYTFTVTIVATDGTVYTCTFIVHVRGPGLRIELCWATTGMSDVDLHLHRDQNESTAMWTHSNDTCYYANCKAFGYDFGINPDWGLANSPIAECSGGPEGADWVADVGYCGNPRLDVDNISTPGIPENINVDNPNDLDNYRIMVHYYSGSPMAPNPLVNIYCGGFLTATYGAAPDLVTEFNSSGSTNGDKWKVADVVTHVDPVTGVTTSCDVTAIVTPMGDYVIQNNNNF